MRRAPFGKRAKRCAAGVGEKRPQSRRACQGRSTPWWRSRRGVISSPDVKVAAPPASQAVPQRPPSQVIIHSTDAGARFGSDPNCLSLQFRADDTPETYHPVGNCDIQQMGICPRLVLEVCQQFFTNFLVGEGNLQSLWYGRERLNQVSVRQSTGSMRRWQRPRGH